MYLFFSLGYLGSNLAFFSEFMELNKHVASKYPEEVYQ